MTATVSRTVARSAAEIRGVLADLARPCWVIRDVEGVKDVRWSQILG